MPTGRATRSPLLAGNSTEPRRPPGPHQSQTPFPPRPAHTEHKGRSVGLGTKANYRTRSPCKPGSARPRRTVPSSGSPTERPRCRQRAPCELHPKWVTAGASAKAFAFLASSRNKGRWRGKTGSRELEKESDTSSIGSRWRPGRESLCFAEEPAVRPTADVAFFLRGPDEDCRKRDTAFRGLLLTATTLQRRTHIARTSCKRHQVLCRHNDTSANTSQLFSKHVGLYMHARHMF